MANAPSKRCGFVFSSMGLDQYSAYGGPAILQSRVWDEAGNMQPTRAEVIAQRGQTKAAVTNATAFPSQHYNGPTSWAIERTGEVKHVYA